MATYTFPFMSLDGNTKLAWVLLLINLSKLSNLDCVKIIMDIVCTFNNLLKIFIAQEIALWNKQFSCHKYQ